MTEQQRRQLLLRFLAKQTGNPLPERKLTLIVEIPPRRKVQVDQETRNLGGKIAKANIALVADPEEYRKNLRPTINALNLLTIGEETGSIRVNPDQIYQMGKCIFAHWRQHYANSQ